MADPTAAGPAAEDRLPAASRWWPLAMIPAGVVLGVVGAFVQADRLLVGTTAIPWGAVLVLVVLVLSIRGATWLALSRWGGWMLFASWLVATMAMATTSPSGDLALSGGGRQMAYLVAGVVLGSGAATLPIRSSAAHP